MRWALSEDNELIEATTRGIVGYCPLCSAKVISRPGKIRNPHWAHKSGRDCDSWGEETPWHYQWKNEVDKKFHEKTVEKNGIKHRADIQLESGITFEFQKKSLKIEERKAREEFYNNLIWVIYFENGKILQTDIRKMYQPTLGDSLIEVKGFSERFLFPPHPSPIFLDFNDGQMFWIREFDEYCFGQITRMYGRFLKKTEFIDRYLLDPNFSDIEELKIAHYHRDYEVKQKELFSVKNELRELQEEYSILMLQKQKEERLALQQKESDERSQKAQKKFDDYNRTRREIIESINQIKNIDSWGLSTELNDELIALENKLKQYMIKECHDDLFWCE
ncbi:competence protein CoiA family protein [Methanoregula sp.]|uniref:competence protein CoiA family protein n=1 Tax=Methanoregula sp. TaxID=2052170 RepID=UPI0026368A15|nr:competence protein CoiA family protein [Methanoregula sp.]MDD5142859.1 competence protein CoiA family protein [Methanoregula sp.]